ncbi:HEAT repeat domain-containing protein [Cyanobacteria bacterium FACHB-63]|nr:HEAT repeat domain-containing protein [Cyanobacteria bacterium FACHB-63]
MLESTSDFESSSEALGAEPLTVEQAIANLSSSDTSLRYYAAWWLGKFQVQDSSAVDALILALEDEDDRTEMGGYPLRRNAARALGKLGDRRAVPGLTRCLECDDFYVRESAAQALGLLGDSSCVPQLMALLEGGIEVAQFVPDRPHLVQPVEAVLEALGALEATEAIDLVRPFLDHPVARVQYAAARSMYQLTRDSVYGEQLVQALQGNDVQLRRSALADLGAIGYVPAADAIAAAPVENSFKLLSCKGLLDYHLRETGDPMSPDAIKLMTLMDQLL